MTCITFISLGATYTEIGYIEHRAVHSAKKFATLFNFSRAGRMPFASQLSFHSDLSFGFDSLMLLMNCHMLFSPASCPALFDASAVA